MSRQFLTPLNLNGFELQNATIQNLGTAPSSPAPGRTYYDTTANYTLVWNGTTWVNGLARAYHTGTQLAATISNLATTVQAYSLSSFALPTANIPMGGFKLTGLSVTPSASGDSAEYSWVVGRSLNTIAAGAATSANVPMSGFKFTGLGSPTVAGDSATYDWTLSRALSSFTGTVTANLPMSGFTLTGLATPTTAGQAAEYSWVLGQVQSAAAGISSKDPVTAVSSANQAALSGLPTVDGVTLTAGQRLLLIGQTTATQNGVYTVASGAWTRSTVEGGTQGELDNGAMWLVLQGTTYAGTQWRLSTTGVVVGTTNVSIVQFGAASNYAAGNGLSLTGSTFSVNPVASGGVLVAAGGVSIDPAVVVRKFSQTIGDGSATSYTVTHGLNTQDVMVQVYQAATPFALVDTDIQRTSTTTITVLFASAPAAGAYRVTVQG